MSSLFRHFDTVAHTFLPFRKMPSCLTENALPGDYKEFLHGLLFPVALVLIDDSFIIQTRTRRNPWRPVIKVHPHSGCRFTTPCRRSVNKRTYAKYGECGCATTFLLYRASNKCRGIRDPLGDDGGVPRQCVCSAFFHSIHGLPSLV